MAERKYSLDEIDAMRQAIFAAMSVTDWQNRHSGWCNQPSKEVVEDRLRTYMLNGTDPQELADRAARARADSELRRLAFPETRNC